MNNFSFDTEKLVQYGDIALFSDFIETTESCSKRQCHEMDIFLKFQTFSPVLSVYALMVFNFFQTFFTTYLIINYLFSSLKWLTYSENAYRNPHQNSRLCDWWMFYLVDHSLAEGKMRQIQLPPAAFGMILKAASCMHFQEQNRLYRVF